MKQSFKLLALVAIAATATAFFVLTKPKKVTSQKPSPAPKIQVAVLLDVSNSMDGLIDQAKAQLWNMVNTIGKAKCPGDVSPQIEISLYEYGRQSNDLKKGYVKQINGFITNLDSLSENLFSLTTNGGDEFCGHVINSSINELQWDTNSSSYKVIFIAGNEDFLQGDIDYIKACNAAKQKSVIVNTIYCGDKMQGIQEHWNINAECGNGSFTNINQDAKDEYIPTPYDSLLFVENGNLNYTYVGYGYNGASASVKQQKMDLANTTLSKSAGLKRIAAKGNKYAYKNTEWDLVDKYLYDSIGFRKMKKNELPDSLQSKRPEEIEQMVKYKVNQRKATQQKITDLTIKRNEFIAAEKAKRNSNKTDQTLETEVEKIIKEQARRFNMKIE